MAVKRALLAILGIGFCHYGATLTCLLAASTLQGRAFDLGRESVAGNALATAAEVLSFPAVSLVSALRLRLPGAAQHAVLAANSLLWGAALYGAWRAVRGPRRGKPESSASGE